MTKQQDSKATISVDWLRENDVTGTTEELEKLKSKIAEVLEIRVGAELVKELSDTQYAQLDEFHKLGDDTATLEWLEKTVPEYKQVVDQEWNKLAKELQSTNDKEALIDDLLEQEDSKATPNLDVVWLQENGAKGTPSELENLESKIAEVLSVRVGVELAKSLSEAQLDEIYKSDGDAATEWLEKTVPAYKQVVYEERTKLAKELQSTNDKEALIDSLLKSKTNETY